jgi:hypothetical protein
VSNLSLLRIAAATSRTVPVSADSPPQALAPSAGALYLGPASVTRVSAGSLLLSLRDGREVEARTALAFAYQPVVGDAVLALGTDEYYVVGVLSCQGQATLAFPGDLELRAVGGRLRLTGDEGVAVTGPSMQVSVGKLELAARAVVERFVSLTQRVSDLLSVHAGKSNTVVDGASYLRAENATVLVHEKVSINGKAIHLG